jgi:transposase
MAKAQFHKNQRVYVKSIGTWTEVEKIVPHWTKGLDEPLRITYDLGLGREFLAEELEGDAIKPAAVEDTGQWRLFRAIANAPKMAALLRMLVEQTANAPEEIAKLSREAASILNDIDQDAPR